MKHKPKNEYVKYATKDMFDNDNIYIYVNHYTGIEHTSRNPNLLNILNSVKFKTK